MHARTLLEQLNEARQENLALRRENERLRRIQEQRPEYPRSLDICPFSCFAASAGR